MKVQNTCCRQLKIGKIQKMIEFFLAMKPPTITAQQHKISNGKFYDPPELKMAKAKLRDSLIPYRPLKPLDGPLWLVLKWCFPISGRHSDGEYKCTKPDTDNLNKALKDVMEELGFYVNDSRVACEIIEKFWADIPGIYVCIEEI